MIVTLRRLCAYMGRRCWLVPLSLLLAVAGEVAGMLPYLIVWWLLRGLLAGGMAAQGEVVRLAWWAAGLAVGGVVLGFLALMCSHLAAFRVESGIRREAMRSVMAMPLGFFTATAAGKVRKVIDDNAGVTHSFLAHQLPGLAATLLVPVVTVAMIFYLNWLLGLACLLPFAAAMVLMWWMMDRQGMEFMRRYMTLQEEMNAEAVEYVRGMPVVKTFQQTIFSFKNFHRAIMAYSETAMRYTRLWMWPMSAYTVVVNSFVFFLAPLALVMAGAGGDAAVVFADFILFVLVTPLFSQSIIKSMHLTQAVGEAGEAVSRLDALLSYKPLAEAAVPVAPQRFDLCFDDVRFTYPGSASAAVDGVSFTVPQGKRVALVGPSGGGKTTIAGLVARSWDVDGGAVRIGGVDVRDIDRRVLMDDVAIVFQTTHLSRGTLRDNITFGKAGVTQQALDHAIDMARCRDIIDKMPDGLDTPVGTGGVCLSGGECQRIALARAILKDAPVVLLDEATAFADPENEHLIREAIACLTRGKTVLMIAHRLTSVTDADEIIVVDGGRVVERGDHLSLAGGGGVYAGMWAEYRSAVEWTIKEKGEER